MHLFKTHCLKLWANAIYIDAPARQPAALITMILETTYDANEVKML